jgi:hypothetical protein
MLKGDINRGSTTEKKTPLTNVDGVYNLRVYEVDSLEVGEQLSALEVDIVDWHWDESVHGILYARFATSDRMEETRCSSSYVAYMEADYLRSLSRWGALRTHNWFKEGSGGLVDRVLSASPPKIGEHPYLSE